MGIKIEQNASNTRSFTKIEPYSLETEYDYLVSGDTYNGNTYYKAVDAKGYLQFGGKFNKGLPTGNSTNLQLVVQAVINALSNGGYILLKNLLIPSGLSYGDNILICSNYQGERSFYQNNSLISTVGETPSGIFVKGDSYIIQLSGSTVQAVNGLTGNIDFFSNSDAGIVFNAVSSALASIGGSISIRQGTYNFITKWSLGGGIKVKGNNAKLVFTGVSDYIVDVNGNSPESFIIGVANPVICYSSLSDLRIVGDSNALGVRFVAAVYTKILDNVFICNCTSSNAYGLTLEDVETSVIVSVWCVGNQKGLNLINNANGATNANTLIGCHFQDNISNGVEFNSTTQNPSTALYLQASNHFIGCVSEGNGGWGWVLNGASFKANLDTCWAEANTLGDLHVTTYGTSPAPFNEVHSFNSSSSIGLVCDGDNFTIIDKSQISGSVSITSNSNSIQFNDNRLEGSLSIAPTTPISIKRNQGFVTESTGMTSALNGVTSVTFNHGLAGSPTFVTVSAINADPVTLFWTATSTQITIYWSRSYVSGGPSFSISAKYLTPS